MNQVIESPKKSTLLERQEAAVRKAQKEYVESYYLTGVALRKIKDSESFKEHGFTNWTAYASSGRLELMCSQSNAMVRASEVLEEIPSFPKTAGRFEWPVNHLSEIKRLPSKTDRVKFAKSLIALAKKGDFPTRKKLKAMIDGLVGKTEQKAKDKANAKRIGQQLATAEMPHEVILDMWSEVKLWIESLEAVSNEFWEDAVSEDSSCVENLAGLLEDLASFLRG